MQHDVAQPLAKLELGDQRKKKIAIVPNVERPDDSDFRHCHPVWLTTNRNFWFDVVRLMVVVRRLELLPPFIRKPEGNTIILTGIR